MAIVKLKPTSAGRRAQVKVVNPDLHKGRPVAALVEKQTKNAGRNNYGRITMRHQGGGHKQHYRLVDFRRNKDGIPAKVERIEYDPNRSAHIALLCYADGERRYIIAPRGCRSRSAADQRCRSADQAGQRPADPQHPGRLDDPLHRDGPRQGCPARARRRHLGAAARPRRLLRPAPSALRRDPPRARRVPRDHR
jgi:hypothetical protein